MHSFMTTEELQHHHKHLRNSLMLLDQAESGWSAADRKRGEVTRRNLDKRIDEVEAELHMAGFQAYRSRLKSA